MVIMADVGVANCSKACALKCDSDPRL